MSDDDSDDNVEMDIDERVFEHYLELPPNVRTRMINKMRAKSRCLLTQCSKLCKNEVETSKYHVHGLKIIGDDTKIELTIDYDDPTKYEETGYTLLFEDLYGRKIMNCENALEQFLTIVLDGATDLVSFAGEKFKIMLSKYQKTMKCVVFEGYKFRDYDFEIESMNRLEEFTIDGDWDIQSYFSKIPHPLKEFNCYKLVNNESIANCEQLYQVQKTIHLEGAGLNYEQFLRLAAPAVHMSVTEMTEREILKIIRSWQDGTSQHKVVSYGWDLDESNFDVFKLLRLCRIQEIWTLTMWYEIKHYNEPGKFAVLGYFRNEPQSFFFDSTTR